MVRVADCTRMIVKALREGEHHALLLQVRLEDNARAALAQLALHNPHIWANSLKPVLRSWPIYVSCVVLLLRHLFFPPHLFG